MKHVNEFKHTNVFALGTSTVTDMAAIVEHFAQVPKMDLVIVAQDRNDGDLSEYTVRYFHTRIDGEYLCDARVQVLCKSVKVLEIEAIAIELFEAAA